MPVTVQDINRIPDLIKIAQRINRTRIEVGVFGSDDSFMAMIATVHEFGMTIKAKKRFLAIPSPAAGDRKPRDIAGLIFIPLDGGKRGLLVREETGRGRRGARSTIYFYLVPSVTIPERSFIRSTFDEELGKWSQFVARLLGEVFVGRLSIEKMFERIGQRMVADIQEKMRRISDPPNAPLTKANKKGADNPLIDSGRMRQSVTYKVVTD